MILKALKTIRNNWKKSTVIVCVAAYGVNWLNTRMKIDHLMRVYCEEAIEFGNEPLNPYAAPRHVTVILNPVSKDRKCKQLYEKYVSPLFNCAGIKVSVLQTESEGEAKNLMNIMQNTDAVVVVGGLGTVHESITGLLRRNDSDSISTSLPIGVIPMSKRNYRFSEIFDFAKLPINESKRLSEVRIIAESAMTIIRETKKTVDVIKIEGKEIGKPVYAFNGMEFGILNDLVNKVDKYWYFGSYIKPYYSMIRGTILKNRESLNIPVDVNISYTEPCNGCSKCYQATKESKTIDESSRRWWHAFVPRKLGSQPNSLNLSEPAVDYSSVVNEKCGVWRDLTEKQLLNVAIRNSVYNRKMQLMLHLSDDMKKSEIIREGINLYKNNKLKSAKIIEAQNIRIKLAPNIKQTTNENENELENPEDKNKVINNDLWFSIDSERYESQSVELTLLPRKVNVYC
ncbi:acylglycerol kinase-like protein [Dinothrombium tinctorium]|uniref:Acylglycerol kinase-like protein n=1 Tax=Dinothrombium tinctorium TaxID=1965070 RepID=A0A3S3NV28_9ACAR|nr:acylglycerol kinase-like protein [Dinothrombium tinctorium]RWS07708.1 acylglycerol kinase-like protein [Dinothrombium tinctorium]